MSAGIDPVDRFAERVDRLLGHPTHLWGRNINRPHEPYRRGYYVGLSTSVVHPLLVASVLCSVAVPLLAWLLGKELQRALAPERLSDEPGDVALPSRQSIALSERRAADDQRFLKGVLINHALWSIFWLVGFASANDSGSAAFWGQWLGWTAVSAIATVWLNRRLVTGIRTRHAEYHAEDPERYAFAEPPVDAEPGR